MTSLFWLDSFFKLLLFCVSLCVTFYVICKIFIHFVLNKKNTKFLKREESHLFHSSDDGSMIQRTIS